MKKILIVSGDNLSDEQKKQITGKYKRTHNRHVQFSDNIKFEYTDVFNYEYASTCLCHIGIVLYAKSFGICIPDTLFTRKSLKNKVSALSLLVKRNKTNDKIDSTIVAKDAKQPNKEDFTGLLDDDSSIVNDDGTELLTDVPLEDLLTKSGETSEEDKSLVDALDGLDADLAEPEPEVTEPEPEPEVKAVKAEVNKAPKNLKCNICGAVARTKKSYLANHGLSCQRRT